MKTLLNKLLHIGMNCCQKSSDRALRLFAHANYFQKITKRNQAIKVGYVKNPRSTKDDVERVDGIATSGNCMAI